MHRHLFWLVVALLPPLAFAQDRPPPSRAEYDAHTSGWISVREKGATGNGSTDDTVAIQAALEAGAGGEVYFPPGKYLITAKLTTQPGTRIRGDGFGSVLKKGANGYMLNLARWSSVESLAFDGNSKSFTGGGIEITTGDNTPSIANQGHQRIERCAFWGMDGYAVDYTVPNKGWMSKVARCTFGPAATALAAVRWPDEPTHGGNRSVLDSYSALPIVNVNGADNGIVEGNAAGTLAPAGTNQGIVFPAGTSYRAKKIVVAHNRFGIMNATINIRGIDLQFSDNELAGSVIFESNARNDGAANVSWRADNTAVSVIDNSGTSNWILLAKPQDFKCAWTSSGEQPSFGNADVRCQWTRSGAEVHATYFIKFGSTSTFGSGTWYFSVPIARYSSLGTDYVGIAYLGNQPGVARTLAYVKQPGVLELVSSAGAAVTANSPFTWNSSHTLIIDLTYHIF